MTSYEPLDPVSSSHPHWKLAVWMSPDSAGPRIDIFCDVQQREAAAREEFEVI